MPILQIEKPWHRSHRAREAPSPGLFPLALLLPQYGSGGPWLQVAHLPSWLPYCQAPMAPSVLTCGEQSRAYGADSLLGSAPTTPQGKRSKHGSQDSRWGTGSKLEAGVSRCTSHTVASTASTEWPGLTREELLPGTSLDPERTGRVPVTLTRRPCHGELTRGQLLPMTRGGE